jgi:hypothetical protein
MLRFLVKKKLSEGNNKKIEEAKKKAMEMYEKMRNEEKIKLNRKLEEEIKSKDQVKKTFDVDEYKSEDTKKKIEEIFDKFEFIEKTKKDIDNRDRDKESIVNKWKNRRVSKTSNPSDELNLNYYNKIENDVLLYKLSDFYKANIDKEKWVKIYEAKYDPNYEKMINFLLQVVKILIFYKSLVYVKKYFWGEKKNLPKNQNEKNSPNPIQEIKTGLDAFSKKDLAFMLIFYSFTLGFYFINIGFFKRNVAKMLIKNDKARIFYTNSNKTKQNTEYFEIPIERLTSITSNSKTMHEVLYLDERNKAAGQFFLYKNAFYDKNFLVNLCHPKVKRVRFTNVNLE